MKRLGRAAAGVTSPSPRAVVVVVSYASSGETSSDTHPSTPLVWSWTGRNRSAARVRSSSASSKNRPSPACPGSIPSRIAAS